LFEGSIEDFVLVGCVAGYVSFHWVTTEELTEELSGEEHVLFEESSDEVSLSAHG
jgi:hypothetical protein